MFASMTDGMILRALLPRERTLNKPLVRTPPFLFGFANLIGVHYFLFNSISPPSGVFLITLSYAVVFYVHYFLRLATTIVR